MEKISFQFNPIPKDISKFLCQVEFSSTESRIFWFIYDQTYSFEERRGDYRQISLTKIATMCGIASSNISKFLQRLVARRIILTKKINGCNACKINTNVKQWKGNAEVGIKVKFPKNSRNKLKEIKACIKNCAMEKGRAPTQEELANVVKNFFKDEWNTFTHFENIDFQGFVDEIELELKYINE